MAGMRGMQMHVQFCVYIYGIVVVEGLRNERIEMK
jgi:hypothetical protein